MAKEVIYCKLADFAPCLKELIRNKEDFQVSKTSYTRKITKDAYTLYFNDTGESDFLTLCLINKVRKDARKFKGLNNTSFIDFFNMNSLPNPDKVISKIDIKSAYWNYALNQGIIQEDTHGFFLDKWKEYPIKFAKGVRLKALGSLATTRISVDYKDGKRVKDTEIIKTELTKPTYMEICRGIDDLMKECVDNVEGCVYYYWDCMFIHKEFNRQAIEFFEDNQFNVSVEETKLEYMAINGTGYLISQKDGNMYMTREENKNFLPDLDEELWNY